jgi:hypothetical protein
MVIITYALFALCMTASVFAITASFIGNVYWFNYCSVIVMASGALGYLLGHYALFTGRVK